MRWSYHADRSRSVAAWLFVIAFLVFAMVIVGGVTRLTGSGLSITQWKPLSGALPPMNAEGWTAAFRGYRRIPQFRLVNPNMTITEFRFIYWWEWAHRELGRLLGLVAFGGLAVFLVRRRIPRRLTGSLWVLFGLGALQPLVGWWMVASGLEARVYVAPERLAAHLGLALVLYGFAVWTGLEAWAGRGRGGAYLAAGWSRGAAVLVALIFFQMLLGALVAGNHAGLVDNDWPLMNGRLIPSDYVHGGLVATLLHSQAAVQFNHRLVAYLLLVLTLGFAIAALLARETPPRMKTLAAVLAGTVLVQVLLGVMTLKLVAPLGFSLAHQVWAMVVLTTALGLAWRVQRE